MATENATKREYKAFAGIIVVMFGVAQGTVPFIDFAPMITGGIAAFLGACYTIDQVKKPGAKRMSGDGQMVSGTCRACGTTLAGVNEEEYDRMFAQHVLHGHGDEAPESVLDEAREVLDEEREQE